MPVDPELVAQIAAQVTAQVLAQLNGQVDAAVEDWPEWDEFGGLTEPPVNPPLTAAVLSPPAEPERGPSTMRQRANGIVAPQILAIDDEGDEITDTHSAVGDVLPLGAEPIEAGNGRTSAFSPHGHPEWFAAQRAKESHLRRQPAWETIVKQA